MTYIKIHDRMYKKTFQCELNLNIYQKIRFDTRFDKLEIQSNKFENIPFDNIERLNENG